MKRFPRSCFTLLVLAMVLTPRAARAQSVADRTPNLAGGWVGTPGTVYFNFLHRFEHGAAPTRKVTNFPTFLVGYAPVNGLLLAANYATNSDLIANYPNEWEALGRWAPPAMGAAQLALTGAWNHASESVDGEATLRLKLGKASLLGSARAFSQGYGGGSRLAFGGGAVVPLGNNLALAGDVISLTQRSASEKVAWGAGLQIRIPSTPHSLSIQATNTNTATLEGSSRGGSKTRWGFEFTIPLTLARWFGGGGGGAASVSNADTVVVTIKDFEFSPALVTVRPGATIVWVNQGQIAHTATADDGSWDSGMIQPGARYARTFRAGDAAAYHCIPHPFMKGMAVVSGGGQ